MTTTTEIAAVKTALQTIRIGAIQETEIRRSLGVIVSRVYALRGMSIEVEDLKFTIRELSQSVSERFPGLSIEEVNIALDKGVKGDYGEYFGLNVVTFLSWIKAYYESDLRIRVQDELQPKQIANVRTYTDEEIRAMSVNNAVSAYNSFIESGKMPMITAFSARIYDFLVSEGVIIDTAEKKRESIEKAKKVRAQEIAVDRQRKTYLLSNALEPLIRVIERQCTDKDVSVIGIAKALLLKDHFADFRTGKKDLSQALAR